MHIIDLFEDGVPDGMRNEKDDNSVKKMGELRKSRLTLGQIKRLRQMNDLRKFEEEKKIQGLSRQYKPAAEAGAVPPL
jgi:hypothetical protein